MPGAVTRLAFAFAVLASFGFSPADEPRPTVDDAEVIEVIEAEYDSPAAGTESRTLESGVFGYSCPHAAGCVTIEAPERSRWAVVEIIDDWSPRTMGVVANTNTWLCDTTSDPLRTFPRTVVTIYVANGECQGLPAIATMGTVRVTFLGFPSSETAP